jgi:hypothetical protein
VALQSISFIVTAAIMRCFMIAYCMVSSGVNLDRADATPAASQTRINRPALMIKPEINRTKLAAVNGQTLMMYTNRMFAATPWQESLLWRRQKFFDDWAVARPQHS